MSLDRRAARTAFIRRWLPQGLRDAYNTASGRAIRFKGIYTQWQDAERAAQGYSEPALFERIENAALAVKNGEAAWEQDGFTYTQVPPYWPVLTCLSQVALVSGGNLTVLDFGGALGSSWLQARPYLIGVRDLHWHIVEQPNVVASGRRHFQNEQLRFHDSLEECLVEAEPNVILMSSLLQYLPAPYQCLERVMAMPVEFLIIDRHPETMTSELLTVQKLPSSMYPASYPCWLFEAGRLEAVLSKSFEKLWAWPGKDPPIHGRGDGHHIGALYVGHFWRRRRSL